MLKSLDRCGISNRLERSSQTMSGSLRGKQIFGMTSGRYMSLMRCRFDFYQQRSFTCQATGHSGYTYFEAQESEVGSTSILVKADEEVTSVQTEASKEINSIFPDGLRSPVLHYVQFQDHHRMDDLGESVLLA